MDKQSWQGRQQGQMPKEGGKEFFNIEEPKKWKK